MALQSSRRLGSHVTTRKFHNVGWILVFTVCVGSVLYAVGNFTRMERLKRTIELTKATAKKFELLNERRMKRDLQKIKTDVSARVSVVKRSDDKEEPQMEYFILESGGASYTRWGRRDCPEKTMTSLVYSGVAAGTHYSHAGGGANYICLYGNITYEAGKYVEGGQGSSHIYGVEFRDGNWMYPLMNLSETENNALQFHSLPCAVCLAEAMVTQIMIPGRERCPQGWQLEYRGYIMGGGHGDTHTSHFICVDEQPHVVPGTNKNDKGSFLFISETHCNSLLCEPFIAGRELRCVVCSF